MGLRERKKLKTREAIQRAAMRLIAKQGYEETTVEEIAAAAEISASTFFNYFPTKEDVVLYDIYDPIAIDMLLKRPKDEPLNVMARRVLLQLYDVFEGDKEMILSRAKLVMDVPELRGRMWDEVERTTTLFATALAERSGRTAEDYEVRVASRIFVAALYEAAIEWMRSNGRRNLASLAEQALDIMEHGAQIGAASRSRPRRVSKRRTVRR